MTINLSASPKRIYGLKARGFTPVAIKLNITSLNPDVKLLNIIKLASENNSSLREFAKQLGCEGIDLKTDDAIIAKLKEDNSWQIFVFFNRDVPDINLSIFVDIINRYAESLIKDNIQTLFIGIDSSDIVVLSYNAVNFGIAKPYYTEGMIYYEDGEKIPAAQSCIYRDTYLEMIKANPLMSVPTDHDVTKSAVGGIIVDDNLTDKCTRLIGVTTEGRIPIFIYQFTDQTFLNTIFGIPALYKSIFGDAMVSSAKRDVSTTTQYGIVIIYDPLGYRVTAVGFMKDTPDMQEWYNGYSEP